MHQVSGRQLQLGHPSSGPVKEALCQFSYRLCYRTPLDGYEYCINHILEDKMAPYKPCTFVCPKTDRKCINVAPKADKRESYCQEHSKCAGSGYKRKCASSSGGGGSCSTSAGGSVGSGGGGSKRVRPPESTATILSELIHSQHMRDSGVAMPQPGSISAHTAQLLDYSDDPEPSDVDIIEQSTINDFNTHIDSNDPDLREYEDIMRNVEVVTGEEVVKLYKEKIIRLQALYIEQFKLLQHELQEARRTYLHEAKAEREKCDGGEPPPQQQQQPPWRLARSLKCLLSHNKFCGRSKLLHERAKQKLLSESGDAFTTLLGAASNTAPSPLTELAKCPVVEQYGGLRCNEPALPTTKYCFKHILSERKQVLFHSCGGGGGGSTVGACDRVLLPGLLHSPRDSTHCYLHTVVPPPQGPQPLQVKAEVSDAATAGEQAQVEERSGSINTLSVLPQST